MGSCGLVCGSFHVYRIVATNSRHPRVECGFESINIDQKMAKFSFNDLTGLATEFTMEPWEDEIPACGLRPWIWFQVHFGQHLQGVQ